MGEPGIGAARLAASRRRGPGAQHSIDALTTALAPAAWGTTYYVTTEHLPPGRPLFTATVRALPVGLAFILWTRRLPVGAWWWRVSVLGALNIGGFLALLFVAAYRLPGGIVATLLSVLPLAVTLLAWPVLGHRPRPRALLLTMVCMVGVALVGSHSEVELDPLGVLAALLAAVVLALGTVLTKRWGRPESLLVFTGWQLTVGGLLLLPIAIIVEGAPPSIDASAVGGYLYLQVVGTGLAYVAWFRGIERLTVVVPPMLGLINPLVAVSLGWVVLDQSLSRLQVLGVAVVLVGIVAAQRADDPTPAVEVSPDVSVVLETERVLARAHLRESARRLLLLLGVVGCASVALRLLGGSTGLLRLMAPRAGWSP